MASDSFFKTWSEQVEKLGLGFEPARKAAALGVDHLEKVIGLQLEAAQAYAELAVGEARAALEIKDANDFQSYLKHQQDLAKTVNDRVKGDTEKVMKLNQGFVDQIGRLTNAKPGRSRTAKAS